MQRLQPDPLYAALEQSLTEDQFEAKKFFKVWFRQYGEPYFFLFTKNLKVTNMQVAELHALLRTHIVWRKTKTRVRDFQLIDVHEFYESVQSLHNSFNPANSEGSVPGPTSNDVIPELYGDLIRDIVCIQLFFGSCAVFLPPGMTLNPLAICAESGYIHSCGPSVWNRKIAKATKKGLTDRLEEHLNKRNIKKARLIVYAHEDFTEHDRNDAQALKDGLDDVKLHLEKYYIGKESLVQVLQKIQVHFGDRLEVAEPEHYKKGKNSSTVSTIPVIWLLVERTPTSEIIHRGKEQYYVLYEQEYKNENPLHIFDENKPAWIDHTTIPHTLVAAMINITRPWWREDQSPTFADPFVGTGTTWLEAIKFDSIQSSCGDSEPLSPLAIQDNVEFFCANNETLLRYIVGIRLAAHITVTRTGIIEDAPDTDPDFELLFKDEDFRFQCIRDYDWARRQFALARPDSQKRDVSFAEVLSDLKGGTELQRILFYLLIRTHRRHFAALVDRASSNQHKAFGKEATLLAEQISTLRSHVQRRESAASATGAHLLFEGKYSRSCTMNANAFVVGKEAVKTLVVYKDATEFGHDRTKSWCDLIVTDPPYGVNAEHDSQALARLYQTALGNMVRALRDGGQIVIALPDWSYIGKQVPFFVTKQFITQQILAIAEKEGREIVQTAHSVPTPAAAYRAPFYWESERALRRAIVHFRFRDLAPPSSGAAK